MCANCFDTQIETFTSLAQFKNFEKQLENKLRSPNGLYYFRQSAPNELISYTIYGCKSCDAKWYLSVPIGEHSGCFLESEQFQPRLEMVNKNDSRWRMGTVFVCVIVMLICLLLLIDALN